MLSLFPQFLSTEVACFSNIINLGNLTFTDAILNTSQTPTIKIVCVEYQAPYIEKVERENLDHLLSKEPDQDRLLCSLNSVSVGNPIN